MTSERPKAFCHIYAQWDQVGDLIAAESRHLLDLGLVCDATFSLDEAEGKLPTLRRIQAAGGLCAPNIYPASLDPACRDSNWWKYSESECVRLLEIARERYEKLGLGPMKAVNTYTPGNEFVAACRKVGVEYILGFCAPTVIEDGGWEIAHYGSPLTPYFIGEEDYRKPESPGKRTDSVLMSSMELRNPLVALRHWNEGPWCPLNAQAADRWLEPTDEPLPFLQIAEDWLRQTELSGKPKFFHINLQYFFAGRCRDHNRKALEWIAKQRDLGRLDVGGLELRREHLRKARGFQDQTTYWRGEMMGFHVGHRSGCFADVIVTENLSEQSIWQKPNPLPERHYDYKTKWDYPAFEPKGSAPISTDYSDVVIHRKGTSVEIENPGLPRRLPIIVWDAFEGLEGPFSIDCKTSGWRVEIIPHPSGVGGALRLDGIALKGRSSVEIKVQGTPTEKVFTKSWKNLVEAQTFFREGRPYTMLASQTPERFSLTAEIQGSQAKSLELEHLMGIHYEKTSVEGRSIPLTFDGTFLSCWYRLWDVTADQIILKGDDKVRKQLKAKTRKTIELHCPGLVIGEPGFQQFGNIREKSRWDRTLARAAGESELIRANAWFHEQRPDAGEIIVEVHPGIFIPRGSITKVLGHEFDKIETAPGIVFRERCADYPQGWDWGVAAWVQWRHLRLTVIGLNDRSNYQLHLNAMDPEHRGITQQVYFFDPRKPGDMDRAKYCAVSEWVLPKGIENRFQPGALCTVEIPKLCLEWPSVGIWIVPKAPMHLYDWVKEQGAPGLFTHLWITHAK